MELSNEEINAKVLRYVRCRNDLFRSISDAFSDFIFRNDPDEDYPKMILDAFLKFENDYGSKLDFEFSQSDFEKFHQYSESEWISIYNLFCEVFGRNHELDNFINLFFCDLIFSGPFGEDIESLDMSEGLLNLMDKDVKELYSLFDDYFNTRNPDLIAGIVNTSKSDAVPYFMAAHLAGWICDDIEKDEQKRKSYGETACELYAIAINKLYKRRILFEEDILEISGLKGELEMTAFGEDVIEETFSKMNSDNNIYLNEIAKVDNI